MKTFLGKLAVNRISSKSGVDYKHYYDENLDRNILISKEVDQQEIMGTQTVTKIQQEAADTDFNSNSYEDITYFGTQTKTSVKQENSDIDYTEPPPHYYGTSTNTDVDAERSDTDYHDGQKPCEN